MLYSNVWNDGKKIKTLGSPHIATNLIGTEADQRFVIRILHINS